jgi:hypothetical protein
LAALPVYREARLSLADRLPPRMGAAKDLGKRDDLAPVPEPGTKVHLGAMSIGDREQTKQADEHASGSSSSRGPLRTSVFMTSFER